MVTFIAAQESDAEALAELVNSAYRGETSKKGWTTEADLLGGQRTDAAAISELIQTPGAVILREASNPPLACVELRLQDKSCYLGMLTVRPWAQGLGLGSFMLEAAEDFARSAWQATHIEMTVISVRAELLAWYIRRGYRLTGERKPFPYGNLRFGQPKVEGLEFVCLMKDLFS